MLRQRIWAGLLLSGWLLLTGFRPGGAQPAPTVTLPNGLRIRIQERHTSPLVAIDLWVQAGAREEARTEQGAAHFLEHTLFKGTTTRRPGETDIAIENLGGALNAATGPDYAHFYTTVASTHFPEALVVLADTVRNATLPDREVERERQVILDELAQRDSDPISLLIDRLYNAALPGYRYGHPPGGEPAQIRVRGRDTLAAFYRRNYAPERCTLVLVGDLTPARAQEAAAAAFGTWTPPATGPASQEKTLPPPPEPRPGPWKPAALEETADLARPVLGLAFRAPAASNAKMACAAQLVAALLGDNETGGRLADPALAGVQARARFTPRRDESLFLLTLALPVPARSDQAPTAETTRARLSALRTTLLAIVRRLQTAPPSTAELQNARQQILGRTLFELETDAGLAAALGYADLTGGDSPEPLRARLQQLTAADVRQFLADYLDPEDAVSLTLLPNLPGSPNGNP